MVGGELRVGRFRFDELAPFFFPVETNVATAVYVLSSQAIDEQ